MLVPGGSYRIITMQNAAVATGNGTVFNCLDAVNGAFTAVGFQVKGITTATITWEATIDGTNWVAIAVTNLNTGTAATTATADGLFRVTCAGLLQIRARISAYTSGTITVTAIGVS